MNEDIMNSQDFTRVLDTHADLARFFSCRDRKQKVQLVLRKYATLIYQRERIDGKGL